MLKLLLSELKYSKITTLVVLGIIISANIILTAAKQWNAVLITTGNIGKMFWGIFVIYYVVFAQSLLRLNKINKKNRLSMLKILPISNHQISLFRISFFVFLWIIPIIIFTLFYTINVRQPFNSEWMQIIGFMSVIYLLFTINNFVSEDLSIIMFSMQKKYFNWFSQITVYAIFFIIDYFLITKIKFNINKPSVMIKTIIHQYLLSPQGIELNLIIGIVLLIVSVFTFNKRKSFL